MTPDTEKPAIGAPVIAYVVFEKGLFLGFFDDPIKARRLMDARAKHGPHDLIEYVIRIIS